MSVKIVGLDGFIAGLGMAKEATKPVVEKAALNMSLQVRRLAQRKAPTGKGELKQSITALPIAYGAQTTVEAKYGIYVEEGTGLFDPYGAHLIYPKTASVLAWSSGGENHFAKWTRGMEAQPYFWPAVEETQPYVVEQMQAAADSLVKMAVMT